MGRLLISLFFSLIFTVNSLFANQTQPIESTVIAEAEPNSFVNNTVNAIFGSFYHHSTDLTVPGPQPLHIQRYYNSQNTSRYSSLAIGMTTNYPHWLQLLPHKEDAEYGEMVAEEKGGSIVKYIAKPRKRELSFYLHPEVIHQGLTNAGSHEISSRTNLKNNQYFCENEFHHDKIDGIWTAQLSDGSRRKYHKMRGDETAYCLNLKYEEKPNGNKVLFDYDADHRGKIKKIESTDAHEKESYGWLKFDQQDDKLSISSSNGKYAEYKFFLRHVEKHDDRRFRYLEKVSSSDSPTVHYNYEKIDGEYYVNSISWPEGRFLEVEYDKKGRVITQKAPVGTNGEKRTLYRFDYRPKECHTIVHDAFDRKTVFRYSWEKRLTMQEKYLGDSDTIYRGQEFVWGEKKHLTKGQQDLSDEGHLLAKALFNKDRKTVSCIHYSYDSYGNILKETLSGNLTGKCPQSFAVSETGRPNNDAIERYRKSYTYSDGAPMLKISEAEENGPTFKYGYKKGTDLLTSKFTCDGDQIKIREFFEYDDHAVLTKKIIDDGSSYFPQDMSGVSERRITTITPVRGKHDHGVGKPATIIDSYFDLQSSKEIQLKRQDFEYNKAGLATKEEVRDAVGAIAYTLYFSYDDKGRLVQKTDPLGRTYTYAYDANSNTIREELKDSGLYTTYEYDKANRLTKETEHHKDGRTFSTSHTYNLVSNRTSSTDRFGNTTYYDYDDLNRLIKTTYPEVRGPGDQPCSPTVSQEYDIFDNVTCRIDENGNKTWTDYNIRKQPIKIFYPDHSQELFEYNLNGLLAHKWDKNGTKTSYSYDFLGRVTKTQVFDPDNKLLISTTNTYNAFHLISSTDAMGYKTYYNYDGAGRVVEEYKKADDSFSKTVFEYDPLGRVAIKKEWYDDGDKDYLVTGFKYDQLDRVISERRETAQVALLSKVRTAYDIFGNVSKVTTFIAEDEEICVETLYDSHAQPIKLIDELGHTTRIAYDYTHLNRRHQKVLKKTATDPLGNATIEIFNALGRIVCITQENKKGEVQADTWFLYDPAGNKIKETNSVIIDGKTDHEHVMTWKYDSMDRIQKVIEQPGTKEEKKTSYEYYPSGTLKSYTKPDGITISHVYDALHLLVSMDASDESIAYRYEYDLNGNPVWIKDKVQHFEQTRKYDPWNRLKAEAFFVDKPDEMKVYMRHDSLGRVIRFRAPDSSSVHYSYHHGHLSDVVRYSKDDKELYRHRYNATDLTENVVESTLIGDAGTCSFSWDKKGRTKKISTPYFKEKISEDGFDAAGNLKDLSITDPIGTMDAHFSYDDLYQLTRERGFAEHSFENDSLSNQVKKDGKKQKYDGVNQLLENDAADFEYDENGNLVEKKEKKRVTSYRYDALNRLIEVKEKENFLAKYLYDAFNRRIKKQIFSWDTNKERWEEESTLRFVYFGEREVGALNDKDEMIEFRAIGRGKGAEIGASVAIEMEDGLFAPVHDHRGNICNLLNAKTGKVEETKRYSAFGEQAIYDSKENTREDSVAPWGFASKRYDPETGFVYFGKRYYSPEMGRFITQDPLGYDEGPNLYAYVNNNPLILIDPYGLSWVDDTRDVVGTVSQGIGESMLRDSGHLSADNMPTEADFVRFSNGDPEGHEQLRNDKFGKRLFVGSVATVAAVVLWPVLVPAASITPATSAIAVDAVVVEGVIGGAFAPVSGVATTTALQSSGVASTSSVLTVPTTVHALGTSITSLSIIKELTRIGANSNGYLGHSGWEIKFPEFQDMVRNAPTNINGRIYSGHALDQMQNRGLTPSVVENTLKTGEVSLDPKAGRSRYYDHINNVTVIVEEATGTILTTIPGKR